MTALKVFILRLILKENMKTKKLLVTIFCLASTVLIAQEYQPEANPKAVVVSGNARFTVLSPRVIRMEWSSDGKFTDNASLTFVNRNLPVPKFTKKELKANCKF